MIPPPKVIHTKHQNKRDKNPTLIPSPVLFYYVTSLLTLLALPDPGLLPPTTSQTFQLRVSLIHHFSTPSQFSGGSLPAGGGGGGGAGSFLSAPISATTTLLSFGEFIYPNTQLYSEKYNYFMKAYLSH